MITVSSAPGLGSVMVTFASEIWNSVGHVRSDNAMCQSMLLLTEIVETLNIIKIYVIYIHFQQNYEFDFIKQAKPTHTCSFFGSLHRTRYSLLSKLTRNQQNMSSIHITPLNTFNEAR